MAHGAAAGADGGAGVTYGQGWTPPPPPQWIPPNPATPSARYAPRFIWLGVGAGVLFTIGLPALGYFVPARLGSDLVASGTFVVGLVLPLVLGIVLAAREGSPARRGMGLGLIIGWALAPIIFAGLCAVIVFGAYAALE